jgi:hypothetical protein
VRPSARSWSSAARRRALGSGPNLPGARRRDGSRRVDPAVAEAEPSVSSVLESPERAALPGSRDDGEAIMELVTKLAWLLLGLIHLPPAGVLVSPGLLASLYGVDPAGDLGLLMRHRGALFLAVAAASSLAAFDPPARRALSVVVALSVLGFLALYLAARAPAGPLRTIAIADALALVPLAWVIVAAWRPVAA